MSLGIKPSLRSDDDRIIAILARAQRGEGLVDIERDLGMPKNSARVIVQRVMADDIKFSGENEVTVRAAYRRKPCQRRTA